MEKHKDTDKDNGRYKNLTKTVFSLALAALFVASSLIFLVSGARMLNSVLEVVLGVENVYCERNILDKDVSGVESETETEVERMEKEERCDKERRNDIKRDLAGSISFLVFSLPVAIVSYKQLKKMI